MMVGSQDYRYGWPHFQCLCSMVSSSHYHCQRLKKDTLCDMCTCVSVKSLLLLLLLSVCLSSSSNQNFYRQIMSYRISVAIDDDA